MPKKKLTQAEKIAALPIEQISAIGGKPADLQTLKNYAQTLRTGYNRRLTAIRRKNLYSFAGEQLAETQPYRGSFQKLIDSETDPRRARNKLILEIAKYQQFFKSESATVSGINKINREQDKRIFGVDKRGKPLDTMSSDERAEYWRLYNEYNNQYKNASSAYGSGNIQSMLGDMISQRRGNSHENLQILFADLEENLRREKESMENEQFRPNVLSGVPDTF